MDRATNSWQERKLFSSLQIGMAGVKAPRLEVLLVNREWKGGVRTEHV